MLGRLFGFLRGQRVSIAGTGKLPEGQAKKIDIGDPLAGGKQVVLCRVGGELFALDSLCPHEGGHIAEGPLVEGRLAQCPLHGYKFDPASGRCENASCRPAKRYRIEEQNGDAILRL